MKNKMNRLLFFLLALIVGCSVQDSKKIVFEEIEVEDVSFVISTETSPWLGAPGAVKTVSGGFLMHDYGLEKMHKIDADWNKQFSFGGKGEGPGEFRTVYNFWELDDYYMVYDYKSTKFIRYDFEGNWIEDVRIESEGLPRYRPARFEAIRPHLFVIPSSGKNGSLLSVVDVETDSIHYFGNAIAEYVNVFDANAADREQLRQAMSSGNIPEQMQNNVFVCINKTGIFSFQLTTAFLEKYSYSGDLIWTKSLKIPALDGLFDHFFKENLERLNKGLPTSRSFSYARDIYVNEEGVAILLNLLEDQPVTVVWVPDGGENLTVVTFQGIENQRFQPDFTISNNGSYIYFIKVFDGEIYKATWPL